MLSRSPGRSTLQPETKGPKQGGAYDRSPGWLRRQQTAAETKSSSSLLQNADCMKEGEEITGGGVRECERDIGERMSERWRRKRDERVVAKAGSCGSAADRKCFWFILVSVIFAHVHTAVDISCVDTFRYPAGRCGIGLLTKSNFQKSHKTPPNDVYRMGLWWDLVGSSWKCPPCALAFPG